MLGIEGMKHIPALVEYDELYISDTLYENVAEWKGVARGSITEMTSEMETLKPSEYWHDQIEEPEKMISEGEEEGSETYCKEAM